MDTPSIKSVAFGGFDKQDVVNYIKQAADHAAEEKQQLEEIIAGLENRVRSLEGELEQEKQSAAALTKEIATVRSENEELKTVKSMEAEKTALQEENQHLKEIIEELRPDAEAYAAFREKIGAIECEARQRADLLERGAAEETCAATAAFREKYDSLTTDISTASEYIQAELRKIQVSLTQLPLALNKTGNDLKELEKKLAKNSGE